MLDHSVGSGQHSYKERAQDCYETPPQAVHALLKVEQLPHRIWEPACGPGSIVGVLRHAGHKVYASDLYDYGYDHDKIDFLTCNCCADGFIQAIITNPPYQHAQQFVENALVSAPLVIMLLRLAFYESAKRRKILEEKGLARIHVFRNRLPMMHRRGWNGPKASSAIPFAWFVWERGHQGPTTIDRISWE